MDNDKKLFNELLKADGIDPANITESERMVFRQMLDSEQKRMNRLCWCTNAILGIFALVMIGLCLYEKIFEALRIPFVVGCLVIMAVMLIVMIRYMPRHNRRLRESGRKISKLYYFIHGRHRGIPLVGKMDGKRFIYWPRIIITAVGLWLVMSLGGAGVYYLLCQRWIYSSGFMLHIFFCTVFSLSFVIFLLREGLKAPLDELVEVKAKSKHSRLSTSKPNIWRIIMKSRITKLAAAAVIIIAVLVGINRFGGSIDVAGVAWAQQTLQALEKVEAIVYRQTAVRVRDYSQDDMSGNWETRYYAKDAYRRDIYNKNGEILNTQWILPDGESSIQHEVSFKYRCYWDEKKKYESYYDGLMAHLRRYVSFLDRANRIIGAEFFDGKECIGFEISPGKYGDFTVTRPTRIWFDTETKLPARIERRGIQTEYDPSMKLTLIHDQFDYYVEVPADMFTPQIPQGFVNAHRDEIIAQSKGKLIYADVSQELRDEIISAIKNTQTIFYQEHMEVTIEDKTTVYPANDFFVDKNDWREDRYTWREKLQKTHWYNTEEQNLSDTDFKLADGNFRLTQTTIDYENKTYSVKTYKERSFRSHPMEDILFLASLVNKVDQILENTEIDGIQCFGFEISAIKYGDNPPTKKHRLWFDEKTKLPVRMDFEYWQSDGQKKSLRVRDQFQWDTELAKDTFKPIIPEGFELIEEEDK